MCRKRCTRATYSVAINAQSTSPTARDSPNSARNLKKTPPLHQKTGRKLGQLRRSA
nr:MAG TPA: hypothetical protein [Caudoviricetes sp.]